MTNEKLITHFYQSFADKNIDGMLSCYADDVVFTDPAFGRLEGKDAHDMWRMLLERGGDSMEVAFGGVRAEGDKASAEWWAKYQYGKSKRLVLNEISANFVLRDGKIIEHIDHFDMWKWSRQALGLNGLLLGWTPFLRSKVRQTTKELLAKYQAS